MVNYGERAKMEMDSLRKMKENSKKMHTSLFYIPEPPFLSSYCCCCFRCRSGPFMHALVALSRNLGRRLVLGSVGSPCSGSSHVVCRHRRK
jgi:hypothetical protein